MVKAVQTRRYYALEKLGRQLVAMHNPYNDFLIYCLSKRNSFVEDFAI